MSQKLKTRCETCYHPEDAHPRMTVGSGHPVTNRCRATINVGATRSHRGYSYPCDCESFAAPKDP